MSINPAPAAPRIPDDSAISLPAAYTFVDTAARGRQAAQRPRVIFIEVTNHCNLLCETCPRTFVSYEEPQTLSWDNFLRIVEQFPDMQRAVLHGIGEPLINQELPRMIAHLKARGVTVLFNTNATLLNEAWSRKLIASGLDEMRCSLDGADPQTYAAIRGAPLLHKIVHNLREFTRLQRELGAETPRVSVWMTGMRENIRELPDLVRLSARMGVTEVYVQRMVYPLDPPAGPVGLFGPGHALFDDFDAVADQAIAAAEQVGAELGVTLRASGATDPRHSLAAAGKPDPRPWAACLRPWTTAYVTANGNCLPCCISPFATSDYDSLKMGNLFEQDFTQIWNDARYQRWRAQLLSDQPPAPCAGCGVHWSL
jgi:radical SAM protein with 4Fe4S-binding SPASM domain